MTKFNSIKALLYCCGIIDASRLLSNNHLVMPVLRYHSVSKQADYCTSSIAVTPEQFEWQISYISSRYNIISLEKIIECLSHRRPFPPRSVAITFDDGYLDNYENAFPVLKRYKVPATFFVVSGSITGASPFWVASLQQAIMGLKRPDQLARQFEIAYLNRQDLIDKLSIKINRSQLPARDEWLQKIGNAISLDLLHYDDSAFMMRKSHIIEMLDSGMHIGSHTVSHPILSSLTEEQARKEMTSAKLTLESIVGCDVNHIAFPNGPGVRNYTDDTVRLAQECGYSASWTSDRGVVSVQVATGVYPRQGINSKLNDSAFAFKLEEHKFPWLLRHKKSSV